MDYTERIKLPQMNANQAQKEVVFNEAMELLDFWVSPVVKAISNNPPVSPSEGDAYLVDSSPTGVWVNHSDDIAFYLGGIWNFLTPFKGAKIRNDSDGNEYSYNGSAWVGGGSYEVTANKVTSLSASSTDTEYPSAKCVYDEIVGLDSAIALKANSSDVYDKSDVDTLLSDKADVSDLDDYLPLTGGTLTGGITISGRINFASDNIITYPTTDAFNTQGSGSYKNGGAIILRGKDYSGGGQAMLSAGDGTNAYMITIAQDGTTACPTPSTSDNSTKIATTAFVNGGNIIASGVNYVRFQNGIQICWLIANTGSSYTWTYPVAFNAEPAVSITSMNVNVAYLGTGTKTSSIILGANGVTWTKTIAVGNWR